LSPRFVTRVLPGQRGEIARGKKKAWQRAIKDAKNLDLIGIRDTGNAILTWMPPGGAETAPPRP
jgi:hypothetical protein